MNLTHAIFLVNKGARAMKATYEPGIAMAEDHYGVNTKGQRIKDALFKTLDQDIKVGDIVVVPTGTRHGFTCVKIIETDVSIDFEDKTPVEWIIATVDTEAHKVLLKNEEDLMDKIRQAEMDVRREQLSRALNLGDNVMSLPLAKMQQGQK